MDNAYRTVQNYVGQAVIYQKEIIHFICPKPEDLSELMYGLIETHKRIKNGDISPVIHAAIVSYGFVYLHPFEDGNGRIHRSLIHNILAIQGMLPKKIILPILLEELIKELNFLENYDKTKKAIQNIIDMPDHLIDLFIQLCLQNKQKVIREKKIFPS